MGSGEQHAGRARHATSLPSASAQLKCHWHCLSMYSWQQQGEVSSAHGVGSVAKSLKRHCCTSCSQAAPTRVVLVVRGDAQLHSRFGEAAAGEVQDALQLRVEQEQERMQ